MMLNKIKQRGLKMVARIVYKNKTGWKTGKSVYYEGSLAELETHAKKEARGRDYRIQPLQPENIVPQIMPYIAKV